MNYDYMTEYKGIPIFSEFELSAEKLESYHHMGLNRYGDNLGKIEVKATDDPDFVDIRFIPKEFKPFQRIRRITGYLSSVDRFNNAKLAELNDRVKHEVR